MNWNNMLKITLIFFMVCFLMNNASAGINSRLNESITSVVLESRLTSEKTHSLFISITGGTEGSLDEIHLKLAKGWMKDITPAKLPEGWIIDMASGRLKLKGKAIQLPLFIRLENKNRPPSETDIEILLDGNPLFKKKLSVIPKPPITTSSNLKGILELPRVIVSGDLIRFKPLDPQKTPLWGTWKIAGESAVYDQESEFYHLTLPDNLNSWDKISASYTDPFGFTLYDTPELPKISIQDKYRLPKPFIHQVTEMVFIGDYVCVSGYFPDKESKQGLRLNGQPLDIPIAFSNRSIIYQLPIEMSPGEQTINGDTNAGFDSENSVKFTAIRVNGAVDRNILRKGGSTPLQLWIEGTEQPVSLDLVNKTPSIIALEGGDKQVITTSGGKDNRAKRTVTGLKPGNFNLMYSLTLDLCPFCELDELVLDFILTFEITEENNENLFNEIFNNFQNGRNKAYDSRDKLRDEELIGYDSAREALDIFNRTKEKIEKGLETGEIGEETARTFLEFIDEYETQLKTILEIETPYDTTTTIHRPTTDKPYELPVPKIFLTPPDIPTTTDEEEKEVCCGIAGNFIYYPFTRDPQEIIDIQFATHDDRTLACQVMPHNGGFIESATDLALPSVGIDFVFQRVYRSDVSYESGGILGNHWDFNFNKRIVPVFPRVNADGLGVEIMNSDMPQLHYYDGTGHQDLYTALHQEWRTVHNFGKEYKQQKVFRAFVTTYLSPQHEFLEIQRYIVDDPQDHPFKEHPNVHTEVGEALFYVVRLKHGQRFIFNCRGQMIYMLDKHNNEVDLRYDGEWNPLTHNKMLSLLIDTAKRKYTFKTDPIDEGTMSTNYMCQKISGPFPIPRLTEVIDPAGRKVEFHYGRGQEVILEKVVQKYPLEPPFDNEYRSLYNEYRYEGKDFLTDIIRPKQALGNKKTAVQNKYDGDGRVTSQIVGSKTFTIRHNGGITVTDSEKRIYRYDLTDIPGTRVIGAETVSGNSEEWTTHYSHNQASLITRIQYPRGNSIEFVYSEANTPVTGRGFILNWFNRGLNYENDLAKGNLLAVIKHTHRPNMRVEYKDGQISVRYGQQPIPGVPSYTKIQEACSYEPLFNELDTYIDPRGTMTSYKYDYDKDYGHLGVPVEIMRPKATRPDGSQIQPPKQIQSYSSKGELLSTSAGSTGIQRTYNDYGWLTSLVYPDGSSIHYSHRSDGNVIRITRSEGYAIEYERDELGYLKSESIDPDGEEIQVFYVYDLHGNLINQNQVVKDLVSDEDRSLYSLPSTYYGSNKITHEYNDYDQRIKSTFEGFDKNSANGSTSIEVTYCYDSAGRMISTTGPSPAGGTSTITVTYDARDLIKTYESGGEKVEYTYDANGNQAAVKDGKGHPTQYVFDGFDRLIAVIDNRGGITSQYLDENGNVTRTAFEGETGAPDGSRNTLSEILSDFDEYDREIRVRENTFTNGYVTTSFFFDANHFLERQVGPGIGSTRYTYDVMGRIKSTTDGIGNMTEYTYNASGFLQEIKESENVITYDKTSQQTGNAHRTYTTSLEYDKFGNLKSRTARGQPPARMWYDSRGLVRTVIDENGRRTLNTYDSRGRLIRILRSAKESRFVYNAAGAKTRAELPSGIFEWTYNPSGQVLIQRDVSTDRTQKFTYNNVGQLIEVEDPNGTKVSNTFDSRGRLIKIFADYEKSTASGPQTVTFKYNGLGQAVEAVYGNSTVKRQYDGIGNIIREEQSLIHGPTYVLEATYAADLSEKTLKYPSIGGVGDATVKWTYDEIGRIKQIYLGNYSIASYYYSGADRISRRVYGNSAQTIWLYDSRRRVTEMFVDSAGRRRLWSANSLFEGNTLIDQKQLFGTATSVQSRASRVILNDSKRPAYAETSMVKSSSDSAAPTQWIAREYQSFDENGRLASQITARFLNDMLSEVRKYEYSFHKNKISQTRVKGANFSNPLDVGRLNFSMWDGSDYADGGDLHENIEFTYDHNGNLINDGQFSYQYDADNRLISAYMHYDSRRRDNEWVRYIYDAFGRRISQEHGPKSANTSRYGRQDIRFIYHGTDVIAEVLTNRDGSDSLLAAYVHGARPGEIVQMHRRRNDQPDSKLDTYYVHEDMTGGISFLTDNNFDGVKHISSRYHWYLNETMIDGTDTRMPYLSWNKRSDAFTEGIYDETTSMTLTSFRRTPWIAEQLRLKGFREEVLQATDELARVHLAILAIATLPVTLPAAAASYAALIAEAGIFWGIMGSPVTWGLFAVGLDYGMTSYVGGDYHIEQAYQSFGLAALGAGIGNSLARFSSLSTNTRIAVEFGVDVAAGSIVEYADNGGQLTEAVANNMLFSGIGAVGSRIQAAVSSQQAHQTIASSTRKKAAASIAEAIDVDEFSLDTLSPKGWMSETDNGRTTIPQVMEALRVLFRRGIDADGKVLQHSIIKKLLEELDNGTLQWDTSGRRYGPPKSVALDPDLRGAPTKTKEGITKKGPPIRGVFQPVGKKWDRIRLRALEANSGNPVKPAELALVLIHEYLHYIGANERTARRLQYLAYKRLERNVGESNLNQYLSEPYIKQFQDIETEAHRLNRLLDDEEKNIRLTTLIAIEEKFAKLPCYREKGPIIWLHQSRRELDRHKPYY